MSIASDSKHCPKCQTPLPEDAPQGLCPKCLLAAAAIPTEAGQTAPDKTPPSLTELATAFPQLEILELIGQGGMGFVFKARQPKLDRFVALKILPQSLAADPEFAERFSREGRVLAKLNHPNIVTVHDFGVASSGTGILPVSSEAGIQPVADKAQPAKQQHTGGTPVPLPNARPQPQFYYLLMEFVDGVNLRQAMRAGRFTPDQALAIVPKICEALQFAHNEGILHRDIKPENILLDAKGRVKIADFGIAKLVAAVCDRRDSAEDDLRRSQTAAAENLTEAGKALGTPNYMAPEQRECSGEVDHRADIYSLGVVFYEMLTGELPLGRFAPPSQKSAADPRVDEVVLRALEKEKAKRYASADEVKTQVETIATTPPGSSRREEAQTEKSESGKRKAEMVPRFSRTAIAGACWIPVSFMALAVLYWLRNTPGVHHGPGTPMRVQYLVLSALLLLGVSGGFGTTILGWIAVSQIRRSAGKLYGLWLAVFDGLLFPLLVINAGLISAGKIIGDEWETRLVHDFGPSGSTVLKLVTIGLVCTALSFLLIRAVWRAMNRGGAGVPSGSPGGSRSEGEQGCRRARRGLWLLLAGSLGIAFELAWQRHDELVLFLSAVTLTFALVLGWLDRRTRLGKGVAIATAGVVVSLALTLTILSKVVDPARHRTAATMREAQYQRQRQIEADIQLARLLPQLRGANFDERLEAASQIHNLGALAEPATADLVKALECEDWKVRMLAASTLGRLKPADRPWVNAALLHSLEDFNRSVCFNAALALVNQDSNSIAPLGVLMNALTNRPSDDPAGVWPIQRREAVEALGKMGSLAAPALPVLRALSNELIVESAIARIEKRPPDKRRTSQDRLRPPAIESVIGPREVELGRLGLRPNCCLDFETGRVLTPPADLAQSYAAGNGSGATPGDTLRMHDWIRESGADLILMPDGRLVLFDGLASHMLRGGIPNAQHSTTGRSLFDDVDVQREIMQTAALEKRMNQNRAQPPVPTVQDMQPLEQGGVWRFKTHEGNTGLLEILDTGKDTDHLRLRCKMLTFPGPADSATNQPSAETNHLLRFRWIDKIGSTAPVDELLDPNDRSGQTRLRLLREVFLDDAAVATATVVTNELGNTEITLHLTDEGARTLARVTDHNVGRRFAIVHLGRILSAPMVKGMVVGREVKIAGNFSEAEALQIVNALNDPARANTFRPFRAISNPVELEIKRRDEAVPPVQK